MKRSVMWRVLGGGILVIAGFVLGAVDRRHRGSFSHTVFDTLGVLAWGLLIFGLVLAVLGLIDYSATKHRRRSRVATDSVTRPWRWGAGVALLLCSGVAVLMAAVVVSEVVKRIEGDAKPKWGAVLITVIVAAAFAAFARQALVALLRRRPPDDNPGAPPDADTGANPGAHPTESAL